MNELALAGGPVRPIERTSRSSGGPIDFDLLRRKSWPGISAECVRLTAPIAYDFRLKIPANFLMHLNLHRSDGETEILGSRTHRKDLRQRLSFVPADCEISGWTRTVKPASFTALYFDPGALAEDRCDLSALPPLVEFEDTMLRTAMQQFQAIVNNSSLDQPGYPETLAILLAFEINRLQGQLTKRAIAQHGLTPRQLRIVTDYLESHLSDRTTIAELSALLDLSRFHFIRAFKKVAGMPPHQFIMHRRIERARELLASPDLSVVEVAERTGFNGSPQLTRAFRRIVGTTPSEFRRSL